MRHARLMALLVIGLVAAPAAFAAGSRADDARDDARDERPGKGGGRGALADANATTEANGTDDANDTDEANESDRSGRRGPPMSVHERREARNASDAERGPPAWVLELRAHLKDLRERWLDGTAEIRESCRAAEAPGENATRAQRLSWAHCIRDGYAALRAELLEEHRAWLRDPHRA